MFPFLFSIYFASAILFITHDWKKQKKTKQMKRLVALFCSHAKTKNVSVRTDLKYLTTRNMTNLIPWHSNQTWIDQNRRSEENKLERNQVSLRQSDFQENQTILTWFEIENLLSTVSLATLIGPLSPSNRKNQKTNSSMTSLTRQLRFPLLDIDCFHWIQNHL